MSLLKRTLMFFALAVALPPAMAADGAIEINAACVADGCFAGDSPGLPVEIGNSGSYVLTSNLTVPDAATTAISISTADVTLNLNGFTLSGPVSCTGTPATCSTSGVGNGVQANASRIHVYDGNVVGFGGAGIAVGAEGRLDNLRVASNGGIGISVAAPGVTISDCKVVRNGGVGIDAYNLQAMLELSHSLIRGNGGYGARVQSGVVTNNRFSHNADTGLRSYTTSSATAYAQNILRGNGDGTAGDQVLGGEATGCNVVADSAVCPP